MNPSDPWANVKVLLEFQFQDLDRRARILAEREESIAKRERELMIMMNNFQDERRMFETELMSKVRGNSNPRYRSGGGGGGGNRNYDRRDGYNGNKRYRNDYDNNQYDPSRPQYSNRERREGGGGGGNPPSPPRAASPPPGPRVNSQRPTSPYYDPQSPKYQSSNVHPSEV